jgi:hypothetical protein
LKADTARALASTTPIQKLFSNSSNVFQMDETRWTTTVSQLISGWLDYLCPFLIPQN